MGHWYEMCKKRELVTMDLQNILSFTCFQVLGCQPILHHEFFA